MICLALQLEIHWAASLLLDAADGAAPLLLPPCAALQLAIQRAASDAPEEAAVARDERVLDLSNPVDSRKGSRNSPVLAPAGALTAFIIPYCIRPLAKAWCILSRVTISRVTCRRAAS